MIIDVSSADTPDIVSRYFLEGKTVICSCDTIYGIHGTVPDTRQAIINVKGRDENKPFIILGNMDIVLSLTNQNIPDFIYDNWPGPLTVIVKNREGGTTAVRVPGDPFILGIINKINKPLFSTSVNFSGQSPINDITLIRELFADKVDLICDSGNPESAEPSTIIDISKHPYRILRQGQCKISSRYLL